FFVWLNELTF
ncbi:hypothetical protein TYRP_008138, partial [Tyrophagus putrescentiae]